MRRIFTLITLIVFLTNYRAQENYRDFEGIKKAVLAEWNGVMDSTTANTFTNAINSSSMCAKYIRDTALYDNFKLFPLNNLITVSPYADTAGAAPRISMKIRTSAPPGTLVKIQLGTRTSTVFPAGVHSEYTATTTVSNAWELLTFKFWMMPAGGHTTTTNIDKIVVFFHPNSHDRDTVYFDDPTGPELIIIGVNEYEMNSLKLLQNIPNPANGSTDIKFHLTSPGNVIFNLTDMMGRKLRTISQWKENGMNVIPLDVRSLDDGIYFYTLEVNGHSQTKQLIISKQ